MKKHWKGLYIYLSILVFVASILTPCISSPDIACLAVAIIIAFCNSVPPGNMGRNAEGKRNSPALAGMVFSINAVFSATSRHHEHSSETARFAQDSGAFPISALLLVGASALLWTLGYLLLMAMRLSGEVSKAEYERSLRQNDVFLRKLIDNTPYAIVYKNTNREIILHNRYFADSIGKSDDQIRGKTEAELFSVEVGDRHEALDRQAIEMGRPMEILEEFPNCEHPLWFQATRVPVSDENGSSTGLLVIIEI